MRSVPCPISSDRLRCLYLEERLTDQQIVDLLGGGATVKRVRSWRRRFGIETIDRTSRYDVPLIEGRLRSILIGSMLGDGRLAHRKRVTNYCENHAINQRDYAEWKRLEWGAWVKGELKPVLWKNTGGEFPGVRFHTVGHASLNEWHRLFYDPSGPKFFRPEVVSMVDELALAVWYLDDGHADWWPMLTLGAVSRDVAIQILGRFEISARWKNDTPTSGRLIIEGEANALRFLDLIRPHVPECMAHKLLPGFLGSRNLRIRTAAPEQRLIELAEKGVPIRAIGRELGIGASTVDRHLRRNGVEHPRTAGRPKSQERL